MIKLKEVMILEETIIEEVISKIEIKSLIKWLIILEMIQIKIRYNPTIEKATMVTIEFSIVMKMEVYIILIENTHIKYHIFIYSSYNSIYLQC